MFFKCTVRFYNKILSLNDAILMIPGSTVNWPKYNKLQTLKEADPSISYFSIPWMSNEHNFAHLLYGLQAATIFNAPSAMSIGWPLTLPSHIVSLIKPIASVVLTSSKNRTVSMLYIVLFSWAILWAMSIFLMMASLVVPPWTKVK